MKKIKRALISVSDKNNLINLLKVLKKYNIEIISSGGTFKEIRKLKYKCLEVSDYTKSPEILNGRVKTLHPKIHAGILSKRKNKSHQNDLKKYNFKEIDLVIVNFYPFEKTLEKTKKHSEMGGKQKAMTLHEERCLTLIPQTQDPCYLKISLSLYIYI